MSSKSKRREIMQNLIKKYIDGINLGSPQSYKNLTVFPLVSNRTLDLDYLTLDEALDQGVIDVVELSEGGSVPELRVVNKADTMILILDGEELVGAKQNRIVNTTILIAGKDTVVIPVSCVEQGRWAFDSNKFSSQKRVMSPRMRAGKSDQVSFSLKMSGEYRSDQGAVWRDIAEKASRLDAESPSMAMSEIYKKQTRSIKDYAGQFSLTGSQIGAVFVINGQVVGMDCFGKAQTFEKVFEKLVESYALDALDSVAPKKGAEIDAGSVKAFLRSPAASRVAPHPSVGLGTDCRLESENTTGFALVHADQILHLSLFARAAENHQGIPGSRMIRFSHRRNRRF